MVGMSPYEPGLPMPHRQGSGLTLAVVDRSGHKDFAGTDGGFAFATKRINLASGR